MLALLACGDSGGGGEGGTLGQLLVGMQASASGVTYRLNNATMTGVGAQAFTLATQSAMGVSLSQALPPGAYTLRLEDGWSLDRQMGTAFSPVAGATLTSPNPVSFNIAAAQISRVGFTFDAGGVAVDLAPAADDGGGGDDD